MKELQTLRIVDTLLHFSGNAHYWDVRDDRDFSWYSKQCLLFGRGPLLEVSVN